MSDQETAAKFALAGAIFIAVIAFGYFMILVVAPLLVVGLVIDTIMRVRYNRKLANLQVETRNAVTRPAISSFDARYHEGQVIIAWLVDLPKGTSLDIYRSFETPRGTFDDVSDYAVCIHSTSLDFTNTMDDVFIDHEAKEGVQYYIPVIAGMHVEKTPVPYSLFSFSREIQFTTKKKRINARGDAVRVEIAPHVEKVIEDHRDEATRVTDEILTAITKRKNRDSHLDAAIARIQENSDLTEAEKQEAIELLETRIGAQ